MPKIIALCGMICSGKTTYAERLRQSHHAVILNPDILMLALFDEQLGDRHNEIFEKTRQFLYRQAVEISRAGANIVLDFGLWTRTERKATRDFFAAQGADFSLHYLNTPLPQIRANAERRNRCADANTYFINDAILKKCLALFEPPSPDEFDVEISFEA